MYDLYSRGIDDIIQRSKTAICIAAGNESAGATNDNTYINCFGLSPNAITVGAVSKIKTDSASIYSFADYSMYREAETSINKPDVCAPGNISLFGYSASGTSFSTPFVTATLAQMICKKSMLGNQPDILKATLMASAYYNGGTDMSYVNHTVASNEEGAGIINAEFCYNSISSSKFSRYEATCPGAYSTKISCSDRTKPLRISATWYVTSRLDSESTSNLNFDMYLYKNGFLVASSKATSSSSINPNTNYEIIYVSPSILHQYGSGEYTVQIILNGSFSGHSPNYVGIAWGNV